MKLLSFITAVLMLTACENSEPKATDSDTPAVAENAVADKREKEHAASDADLGGPVKAEIDMSPYVFRVHEIMQYHPSGMQAKLLKLDDDRNDYYIINCSIENKTDTAIDVGINSLAAYFKLSNGSSFNKMLSGGAILSSYNTENKPRYPQQQYDLLWSKKFPPGGKARADLYGVAVPEGVTITGVGFYEKSKKKNRYVGIGE